MEIRMATPDDDEALASLRWAWRVDEDGTAGDEARDKFIERFSSFASEGIASGQWTVWLADMAGEVVSNVWVCRVPKVPSPGRASRDFGYVSNVYTRRDYRAQGVGTAVLAATIAWANDVGLEMMIVWPSQRSDPWYRRHGFAPSVEMLELEVLGYEG